MGLTAMPVPASQLSATRRPKWPHVTTGVGLIVVAVALWVGWQILGSSAASARDLGTLRLVVYVFGTLLFLLLIGGLVLIVLLLLREVRLNERQSNFVSAVTHELKTPVASLRLYLDTLQLRELNDERRQEFYRTMRDDIDRLNATINDILEAAMYTDRRVENPQPVDLAQLAQHAIQLTRTRNQLPVPAIRFAGPDSLFVRGDPRGLETALLNLLDNAVKYSRDSVDVEVRLRRNSRGGAELKVCDHGIGMSRAHQLLVFNRFYRIGAEVRRSRTGTGLGLFIVRSVVEGHGGSVFAESPGPDRGTTITVRLPGALEPAEAAPLESPAAQA